MTPKAESLASADQLITDVRDATGCDYSPHRELIAEQLYENGIYNGNYDSSTDLEDPLLRDLRLVQEDEFDQSMDEDPEKPRDDLMLCTTEGGYVWYA